MEVEEMRDDGDGRQRNREKMETEKHGGGDVGQHGH